MEARRRGIDYHSDENVGGGQGLCWQKTFYEMDPWFPQL